MTGDPDLDVLTGRYLPAPTGTCPHFVGDSSWQPIVDAVDHFARVREELEGVQPGDAVLIAGLQLSPEVDLDGCSEQDPAFRPLADRLAELAHDGIDVRILLSGAVFSGGLSFLPFGPFRANVEAARVLRGWLPSTRDTGRPPLRDVVLLDWSSALIGSNHQKVVVVRRGEVVTAYVGGIDLSVNRRDKARTTECAWARHAGAGTTRRCGSEARRQSESGTSTATGGPRRRNCPGATG